MDAVSMRLLTCVRFLLAGHRSTACSCRKPGALRVSHAKRFLVVAFLAPCSVTAFRSAASQTPLLLCQCTSRQSLHTAAVTTLHRNGTQARTHLAHV